VIIAALTSKSLAFRPGLFGSADVTPEDLVSLQGNPVISLPIDLRHHLILFGVLATLTFFLILAFAWKTRSRRLKLQRSPWPADASKNSPNDSRLSTKAPGHRRRRGRQRENLTRNLTLAETKGLPPRRPEDQPPPGL